MTSTAVIFDLLMATIIGSGASIARRGLVVCRSKHAQQLSERVTVVPWNAR